MVFLPNGTAIRRKERPEREPAGGEEPGAAQGAAQPLGVEGAVQQARAVDVAGEAALRTAADEDLWYTQRLVRNRFQTIFLGWNWRN